MTDNYCIYMHKNKTDGKIYVGQTNQKPKYRWGKKEKAVKNALIFSEQLINMDGIISSTLFQRLI